MSWVAVKLFFGGALKGLWGFLAKIPWQVYAVIAALIALWGLWHWHGVKVRAADRTGYARAMGEVKTQAERIAAAALAIRLKAENLQGQINEGVRVDVIQKNADVHRRADALLVRVPQGLAPRCPAGSPELPGSAGRASGETPGADLSGMAVLPWQPLVKRGESCDLYRVQVEGWQAWNVQQRAAWEQWRKDYERALSAAPK